MATGEAGGRGAAEGGRTLTRAEARRVYDRIGPRQDTQRFYEDAALERLLTHGGFASAGAVVELGCGTGRVAERLLDRHLPPGASYLGLDLSPRMVELARRRVARFGARARVELTDGSVRLPVASGSVDRFVSTYVFDLLAVEDVREALAEAHRVLRPGGRIALAGLGRGTTPGSRLAMRLWSALHTRRPTWVGGCRPLAVAELLDPVRWEVLDAETVVRFAIPSEVVVAAKAA